MYIYIYIIYIYIHTNICIHIIYIYIYMHICIYTYTTHISSFCAAGARQSHGKGESGPCGQLSYGCVGAPKVGAPHYKLICINLVVLSAYMLCIRCLYVVRMLCMCLCLYLLLLLLLSSSSSCCAVSRCVCVVNTRASILGFSCTAWKARPAGWIAFLGAAAHFQ